VRASEGADSLAEEIRKLYVGLTRARSHLVISYHRNNAVSEALQAIGTESMA